MARGLVAMASIKINAPAEKILETLTSPDGMKQVSFGADVISAWGVGSPVYY